MINRRNFAGLPYIALVSWNDHDEELGFLRACIEYCSPGERWRAEIEAEIAKIMKELDELQTDAEE
jgi:hypothetical protein